MKIIEARGTHRRIGETIGESLREEIRDHIARFVRKDVDRKKPIGFFTETTGRYMPEVLAQLKGMARGASLPEEDILALNLYETSLVDAWPACSNIVFGDGPDGPLWGKNNEGNFPPGPGRRPFCVLKLYPDDGIPAICFTFCGWLSGGDMLNAEGVACGHSSVGSKFSQSRRHVSVLPWFYAGMLKSRTARDFAVHLTSLPLFGKGYTQVTVDRGGEIFSAELPCPLAQIRRPEPGASLVCCVNGYQLPWLRDVSNRTPEMLANSRGRKEFLETAGAAGARDIAHLKEILRHHGDFSICRHGGRDEAYTEYSMIGVVRERKALVADGNPCGSEYQEIIL